MGIIVRSSDVHAAGVFATSPIRRGSKVVEYTGPKLTKKEGDALYEHRDVTYLFALGSGKYVLDGHGIAAFINHSCDPNCETDETDGRIWVYAMRDIAAGEELTYDYNLFDGDGPAPCYCGAKTCRGSLYSPAELRKIAREEKKKREQQESANITL